MTRNTWFAVGIAVVLVGAIYWYANRPAPRALPPGPATAPETGTTATAPGEGAPSRNYASVVGAIGSGLTSIGVGIADAAS